MQEENEIFLHIDKYPFINLYFGKKFLVKILIHLFNRLDDSKPYYPLAVFIVSGFNDSDKSFFIDLENMLKFFYSQNHLKEYILTPRVKNKLKSVNNVDFNSIWSELIFAYYLHQKGHKILKIGQIKGESTEQADIITDKGLFEVTVVLSERDRFNNNEVFFDSQKIISDSIRIINNKISEKINQNKADFIVIDCSYMDNLYEKIFSSTVLQIKTMFDVFKKTTKPVFLFIRHNVTCQVGIVKLIN